MIVLVEEEMDSFTLQDVHNKEMQERMTRHEKQVTTANIYTNIA